MSNEFQVESRGRVQNEEETGCGGAIGLIRKPIRKHGVSSDPPHQCVCNIEIWMRPIESE